MLIVSPAVNKYLRKASKAVWLCEIIVAYALIIDFKLDIMNYTDRPITTDR